jgi:hypothetical protein
VNELNKTKNGKSFFPVRFTSLRFWFSFTLRFSSFSDKALQQINAAVYDFVHIDARMRNFHALIAIPADLRNNLGL